MDINHQCGYDLIISPSGGLATVDGAEEGQQRVLRRLLTNSRAYLWHLDYGAGLPAYIGKATVTSALKAIILSQMRLEAAVQQAPPPQVTVVQDKTGLATASIRYVDTSTQLTSALVIPLAE